MNYTAPRPRRLLSVLWQQSSGISYLINVVYTFGFCRDIENTELPEQKVHRRYKCLLPYGTCAALPLVWCMIEIIMKHDPVT